MLKNQGPTLLEMIATFLGSSTERNLNRKIGVPSFATDDDYHIRQIALGNSTFAMGLMIGLFKKEWAAVLLASFISPRMKRVRRIA